MKRTLFIHRFQRTRLNPRSRRRGTGLVEFGFAAIALILIFMGIFQFGFNYFAASEVANSAREGARYGSVHPGLSASALQTAVQTVVLQRMGGIYSSKATVTATATDGDAYPGQISVTVSYPLGTLIPGVPAITVTRTSTMYIEQVIS